MTAMNGWVAALQGYWDGEEHIAPSAWGPGGTALATVTARTLANGILVQDCTAVRDGKPWLQAHAVMVPASDTEALLYWFDSFGFVPEAPARGVLEAGAVTFLRTSPRGMTRQTYRPLSDGIYTLTLESSFDGGATWQQVMDGRYVRRGATT